VCSDTREEEDTCEEEDSCEIYKRICDVRDIKGYVMCARTQTFENFISRDTCLQCGGGGYM
jgi:hypothetical protein